MNRRYGRLDGQNMEYAPDAIKKDGVAIANPSGDTYRAEGWLPVVDEPPADAGGRRAVAVGWRLDEGAIVRVYELTGEAPPRVFSKLRLVAALKEADKWVLVKTWIEDRGYWDYYLAAHNLREDNRLFREAVAAVKEYARMTDAEAEAILSKCIYEGD